MKIARIPQGSTNITAIGSAIEAIGQGCHIYVLPHPQDQDQLHDWYVLSVQPLTDDQLKEELNSDEYDYHTEGGDDCEYELKWQPEDMQYVSPITMPHEQRSGQVIQNHWELTQGHDWRDVSKELDDAAVQALKNLDEALTKGVDPSVAGREAYKYVEKIMEEMGTNGCADTPPQEILIALIEMHLNDKGFKDLDYNVFHRGMSEKEMKQFRENR